MEEAPVVVTMATGALGPVVARLSALLGRDEYKLRRRTRKDVKLIRSKLRSIHSVLWVTWEREDLIPDAESKELRREAWDLADDMDDAIDDFILTMKRSGDSKLLMQDKTQPVPFQDLKRTAGDVWEWCRHKWKSERGKTSIISSLFSRRRKTAVPSGLGRKGPRVYRFVPKDMSELVGMDVQRDELVKHLVGEEESVQPQLKMISIVGGPGVGKTTLAHLVYEAIQNKFEARAFVSVTECNNMTEVLQNILQQVAAVGGNTEVLPLVDTKAASEKHLIDIISNFLKGKRYIVVIDDIWHWEEWEIIRKSLPDNNVGSRIVATSHVKSITTNWKDKLDALVHEMRALDYSQVTQIIFVKPDMVGEDFDRNHGIVRMCDGIPLALVCMVSALAKEREHQEQLGAVGVKTRDVQDKIEEQVRQNGIQNTLGFEPLAESLQLSFNGLPHHMLKTCLLYCSIYPENYFLGDKLVSRRREDFKRSKVRGWIAQGFVCKEEVAKNYFDELLSRGLIDWDMVKPMIRNYFRWKLRQENFITCSSDMPSSRISRRLCVDYWPRSDAPMGHVDSLSEIDWCHIRSLVAFEGAKTIPYKDLVHLRVLDVQQFWSALENQHLKDICGLLRLRHMLLGHCGYVITKIPVEIGRLRYLETLELNQTRITRLPAEIWDMKQLKTLDVSNNGGLTLDLDLSGTNVRKVPREIGGLKKLKNSHAYMINALPFEAGQIPGLEGLPRWVHQAWKNSDLVSSLAGEILTIEVTDESLILSTKHMHVPLWIGDHFKDVRKLDIRICKLEEQDLKILREMPMLTILALRFEAVPRKPIAISSEGFAKLWSLTVDSRVPRITFQEGAMPDLCWLYFEFQFYAGPPNTESPMGIKHLVSLDSVNFRCNDWYPWDSPCISATIDAVRKEAQEHPKAKTYNGIYFSVATEDQKVVEEDFRALDSEATTSKVAGSSGVDEIEEIQL